MKALHSGWILLLFGLGMIWLQGDSISVSPTFKGTEGGEAAQLHLMKEFCIGKTLTFEMFNVTSRTGSFRRRSLR